jgi:TonB family protein
MRLRTALAASTALAVSLLSGGPAWPQAAEEPPRTAGSDVPAPKRTRFRAPEYPPDAQARGLRGIVILELLIDTEGKVVQATVTRSVPPFDEAALAAARQWEYEVTRVGGKAVPVRLSVPISFTMPVPRVTRQEGIPELVQGISPAYPAGQDRAVSVVADMTVEASGQVMEIEVSDGDAVFTDALLAALRTWRFAPESGGGSVSFRVEADFVPSGKDGTPRVDVRLAGPRRTETAAVAPSPAPPGVPSPEPVAAASPQPSAAPPPGPEPPVPPVAAATPPPALIQPPAPPVEVLGPAPTPPPPEAPPASAAPMPVPTPPAEAPVSALRDVALSPGVPDLQRGRRPVVPPLARMSSVTGTVEVRFAVDAAGTSSVQEVAGPELLKEAARQTVSSWVFRRTTADRLRLAASIVYGPATATATVRKDEIAP